MIKIIEETQQFCKSAQDQEGAVDIPVTTGVIC